MKAAALRYHRKSFPSARGTADRSIYARGKPAIPERHTPSQHGARYTAAHSDGRKPGTPRHQPRADHTLRDSVDVFRHIQLVGGRELRQCALQPNLPLLPRFVEAIALPIAKGRAVVGAVRVDDVLGVIANASTQPATLGQKTRRRQSENHRSTGAPRRRSVEGRRFRWQRRRPTAFPRMSNGLDRDASAMTRVC